MAEKGGAEPQFESRGASGPGGGSERRGAPRMARSASRLASAGVPIAALLWSPPVKAAAVDGGPVVVVDRLEHFDGEVQV